MRKVIFLLLGMNCAYFTWQVLLNVLDMEAKGVPSPLPPDVRRLVTLQERDAQQSPVEARHIEDVTATQPPGAVTPLTCQALGPFLAESELTAIEKRLNKLGLTAKPQTRYVQEQVGYTVVLPAMEYEEALQIQRRLEKEDITVNIIGMDNVISFGTFSDKSQAEKKLASIDAIGLDPRLEPGYAKRSTYWLVFQGQDNKNEGLAGLTRKNPGLRLEKMACP
jgi:hypothetical protein